MKGVELFMLYAAYGSDLNVEQMGFICPDAKAFGTATIPNYRLLFKGPKTGAYLTIERAEDGGVPVGLWQVSQNDIRALDRYEGYPLFYYKKSFMLPCSDGKRHRVFAYIMDENREEGVPENSYVWTCLAGYRLFGFDPQNLLEAVEHSYGMKRRPCDD